MGSVDAGGEEVAVKYGVGLVVVLRVASGRFVYFILFVFFFKIV